MSARSRARPWFRDPRFDEANSRNGVFPGYWLDQRTGIVWTNDGHFFCGSLLEAVERAFAADLRAREQAVRAVCLYDEH